MVTGPLLEQAEAGKLDAAGSDAAEFFSVHELGIFEYLQVLRDGRDRDPEGFRKARDGGGAAGEAIEDCLRRNRRRR